MIRDSPSHIYHSALPLSPSSSWVRECYKAELVEEVKVLMGLPDQWDMCSRSIPLEAESTAFAHCGGIIAGGVNSDVVLLETITGSRTSVLSGHTDTISSLEFSQDGTLLVSRSKDKTVKLWDIQTGGVIKTFSDDSSVFAAASISPDGTMIAMGTEGGAIRLWDVRTGTCRSIETGQDDAVTTTRFSPIDSRRFISSSQSGTIWQWDIDGHQVGAYHHGHVVEDLAYASDGTRFVSYGDQVFTVQDSESGAVVVSHTVSCETILCGCFSPDGRLIACAGQCLWVWDITIPEPRLVGQFEGHSDLIHFVAFSPSLISASSDRTVKFWQRNNFLEEISDSDDDSRPTESVNLFAEHGTVVTSDDYGKVKTWDLITGRCKSSSSTPAWWSRDIHLAGDDLIMVWHKEKEYHIWDVYKGRLLRTLPTSQFDVTCILKISGDGSKIFEWKYPMGRGGPFSCSIQATSVETGEDVGLVGVAPELTEGVTRLLVHGSKVSTDTVRGRGWDFGGPEVSDYREFPDRPRLDAVDGTEPHWIEDTATKRLVFRLPGRYTGPGKNVECDGRYLLLWSRHGKERFMIMDFDSVCLDR